jgi:predicted porin
MSIKKLLPATIGAILVGGMAAAQADVQVFGHLDQSLNYIDNGDWSGTSNANGGSTGRNASSNATLNASPYVAYGDEDTRFVCTTCSIGFKGSEDLGNGLKAIFKLDFQFDMNERNGNGSITDRDQWLGMSGNFGSVKVGTISTTYKSTGAMLDPGYRTVAQMRDVGIQSTLHSGAGSNGSGRAENTARYDSPSWNGLKFNATYTLVPDSNGNVAGQVADSNGYSAGLSYENGGILVFGNYLTNSAGSDDEAYKVGGKYTLNNFAVFGQYEWDKGLITDRNNNIGHLGGTGYGSQGSLGADTSGDGADQWFLGASYAMGNNLIYGAYGQGSGTDATTTQLGLTADTNNDGVVNKKDANPFIGADHASFEVVGIHKFSKRTLAYAGYVMVDFDQKKVNDIDHYTLGMKHKF